VRRVSLLLLPLLLALPGAAAAQHYTSDLELRRVKSGSPLSDRLSVFIVGARSETDYDATFNVTSVDAATEQQLVFKATNMRLKVWSPQIGMSYGYSQDMLLHASIGVSMITLEERLADIPGSLYGNQHAPIFSYDLDPGLAATVGGTLQLTRFADFTVASGLRITYTSSSHINNDSVQGTISEVEGDGQLTLEESKTEDVSLHLLNANANLGLEWRPRGAYLINHFGLTAGYGFSFGSMTKSFSTKHTVDGDTETVEEADTVGFSLTPSNIIGLYYGWSLFIPRFGNLGIEARALNNLQGSLSYEYIF
jgi:hypothetical protein